MDLKNVTITKINSLVTVFSEKGECDKMTDRGTYGLSFCKEGQITYIQNGIEYISNKSCAVILPKGGTYYIKRDKAGAFPVINFDCLDFLCDTITVIPIQNAEEFIADYERMKKFFALMKTVHRCSVCSTAYFISFAPIIFHMRCLALCT